MKKIVLSLLFMACFHYLFAQVINSPDGKIRVEIQAKNQLLYRVFYNNKLLISDSKITLYVNNKSLGVNSTPDYIELKSVFERHFPPYATVAEITESCNELILVYKEDFEVVFRVFNNAVAYRFITKFDTKLIVTNELVEYKFAGNYNVVNPEVESLYMSFEPEWTYTKLNKLDKKKFTLTPFLVQPDSLPNVLVSESDLRDYPGLNFHPDGQYGFTGVWSKVPEKEDYERAYKLGLTDFAPLSGFKVTKTKNYIAETEGTRNFPWRVAIIEESEINLLNNHIIWLLASESEITDYKWIKPGLVAWDWYNNLGLNDVTFKVGKNTETYKYYIDFAAANKIPYINLDEGWNHNKKIFELNKNIDLKHLISYGQKKNVGIWLWFMWDALYDNLPEKLDSISQWGAVGLKVDFFDRDDQKVMQFVEQLAKECAKRKLMLNLHGIWKPTGLQRTYPNILNIESVIGLENNKFGKSATAQHNVTLPFTRFVVGSADYTPGALYHVPEKAYSKSWNNPKSMTTRCQQLAMYVVYFAPLQMLPEAPTTYQKEPLMLQLLSEMPVIWEQTIPLDGKTGEFVVMARKSANTWYIAGMANMPRTVHINLNFLDEKKYDAVFYTDATDTEQFPEKIDITNKTLTKQDTIVIKMQKSGGFLIKATP